MYLSTNNGRIDVFDALKGVAIILMIVNHVKLDGSFLFRFIGVFHMPLFFILSGYLYKNRSMADMIHRNVKKILLPYLVTCLILWLLKVVFEGNYIWGLSIIYGNSRPLPSSVLEMIKVGPLWFLTAFFCSMIYVKILLCIESKLIRWIVISVVFALSVVFVQKTGILFPFGMTTGLGGTIFVLAGMELKENPQLFFNKKALYLGLLLWLICICIGGLSMAAHKYKLSLLHVVGGVYGTYICYKIVCQLRCDSVFYRFLCYVGKNSLVILCIHTLDRVLKITFEISNYILGYAKTDFLHWQLEIALKFLFVLIIFSILRQIPILRKVYSIQKE